MQPCNDNVLRCRDGNTRVVLVRWTYLRCTCFIVDIVKQTTS